MSPKLLIWISVLLSAVAQIFLKQGMINIRRSLTANGSNLLGMGWSVARERYVWLWGLAFSVALGLWLVGLRRVELSYAYPLVSFGYVLVSILAAIFFRERIDRRRWLAILIVSLGVILISGS